MKKMLRNNIPAIAGLISASLILVAITSITPMNMMALAGGLPMGFASLGLASTGVTPVDIPPEIWQAILKHGGAVCHHQRWNSSALAEAKQNPN